MSDLLPPPNPVSVAMGTSTALTIMKLLSGAGIMGATWAAYTPDRISAIVTLGLYAISAIGAGSAWLLSWWQHYRLARDARLATVAAANASALLSAEAGHPIPVTVHVTPPGMDNTAIMIPATEISVAAGVPVKPLIAGA